MVSRRVAAQLQLSHFLLVILFLEFGNLQVNGVSSTPKGEGPQSKPSAQWRIINLDPITYGWAVSELKFYQDTKCTLDLTDAPTVPGSKEPKLTWTAIASGDNKAPASRAFDRLTWTEWRAQCYMCKEAEAWIGLQFSKPVGVYCVSLYQWGKRDYMSAKVMLQRWEAGPAGTGTGSWQDVLQGSSLQGEKFDEISFVQCDPLAAPEHGRVTVTNGGFYPSDGAFSCSGARLMVGADKQSCQPDGTWPEETPVCWPAIALVILIASIFTLELIAFGLYYFFVVMKKPTPLVASTYIPDDALGSFTTHHIYGVNEAEEDDGNSTRSKKVFQHVVFCFCCRVADTWNSVGLVPYFVGVWIPQMCFPCLPCVATYVRFEMKSRFRIKGSLWMDLWLWTCCMCCVATQEAKHVDHMCDVAEEEAVVMQKAEERKKEKERKIKEQIAEKSSSSAGAASHTAGKPGAGAEKVGKEHEDGEKKGHEDKHHHTHPDFIRPKSVMDILGRL